MRPTNGPNGWKRFFSQSNFTVSCIFILDVDRGNKISFTGLTINTMTTSYLVLLSFSNYFQIHYFHWYNHHMKVSHLYSYRIPKVLASTQNFPHLMPLYIQFPLPEMVFPIIYLVNSYASFKISGCTLSSLNYSLLLFDQILFHIPSIVFIYSTGFIIIIHVVFPPRDWAPWEQKWAFSSLFPQCQTHGRYSIFTKWRMKSCTKIKSSLNLRFF